MAPALGDERGWGPCSVGKGQKVWGEDDEGGMRDGSCPGSGAITPLPHPNLCRAAQCPQRCGWGAARFWGWEP